MYNIVFPDLEVKNDTLENVLSSKNFNVIYFYPKDNTPGCSIQAKEFTELINDFEELNVGVIGVSKDDEQSHKKFIKNKGINFPLLSDKDFELHKKYGAYGEKSIFGKKYMGTMRSVFLVNSKGDIIKSYINIKATGSGKKVLDFIKNM
ncbi:peroxiredoxin [Candidatus Vampirococcus lugosii]|uniref:thioredoxin-dependent peroxiredoxin n=1 Tax=Candidatus Vampirococcus lugosii TaxID=2789015 RepID=A0ABS5QLC4_9BACT|nr:peroxiredoxin [Candidatus Vampirococcus lugosii]MBS8121583.1 Peroxiredoxin, bacterioferritin comigratory like protein, AhpC/TSA family [Candidatus Vampirococcus lugosii]